ncbi:MAG: electron transport complex subunit RsxC [Elusimicrobia bacterium]|nr:electron transport complex subunit RsxC [Elusimicrobiota bacterium]
MEKLLDYTKYKLKPKEEIVELIKDKDNLFVFVCGKCYKEFASVIPEDCKELYPILKENGKNVVECETIDFLCNRHHLDIRKSGFQDGLKKSDNVLVLSCGVGIQTVANFLEDKPVYAVADTIPQEGQHGIALYNNKCAGCATCFLTATQGICPITNCTKELVNGPCGGAKNGKCEVSKDKDCGWEKINQRLKVTEFNFWELPVQFHKYNRVNFKISNKYNTAVREKRSRNFYGGVYPFENKEYTSEKPIQQFPEPETVEIPLSQHTGAVCESLVKVGDVVKVGQKIGDSKSFISAPVHSSVSGKVTAIETKPHPVIPSGVTTITIKADGKNEYHESVKANKEYEKLSKDNLIDIIRDKGIVGLGGAQFPTYVKFKSPKPIDTLILNGCECEPYVTADDRLMIEHPEEIVGGMKILMKILGLQKGYIAIETNKPQAIEAVKKTINNLNLTSAIEIAELPTKYPQGSERMLIKKVTGKDVPLGGLPLDVGVVVNNVGTSFAVYNAVVNGLPLIKRIVTVTGEKIKNKLNLEVKIGTPVSEILDYCGADLKDGDYVLKMGGPMMGLLQKSLEVPVIKGTTSLLVTKKPDIKLSSERSCIKCGRCVDVCPMELYPLYYWYYKNSKSQNVKAELDNTGLDILNSKSKHGATNCIECGCCEYICSSKLPLIDNIKEMKKEAREVKS